MGESGNSCSSGLCGFLDGRHTERQLRMDAGGQRTAKAQQLTSRSMDHEVSSLLHHRILIHRILPASTGIRKALPSNTGFLSQGTGTASPLSRKGSPD